MGLGWIDVKKVKMLLPITLRCLWWIILIISIICFIYGQWGSFTWFQTPCTNTSNNCSDGMPLNPRDFQTLLAWGISPTIYSLFRMVLSIIQMAGFMSMGIILFLRKPSIGIFEYFTSIVFMSLGVMLTSPAFLFNSSLLHNAFAVVNYLGNLYLIVFFLFPDGKFVPKWTRYFAVFLVITQAGVIFFPNSFINPFKWPYGISLWGWVVLHVIAFISQYYRFWISTGEQRRLGKWLIFSVSGFLIAALWMAIFKNTDILAIKLLTMVITNIVPLTLPISITIGVLRYRLWGIDRFLNHTIVYVSLTFCVFMIYIILIGSLAILFRSQASFIVSLFATGLVALLIQPLHLKLQRSVNQLIYGNKNDPYSVFSQLRKRLDVMKSAQSIFPTVTETLAKTLNFPYVSIEYKDDSLGGTLVASYGAPVSNARVIPITYLGDVVGALKFVLNPHDERLTSTELRFLSDIAKQLGFIIKAQKLTDDLQRSRERLVNAREEERRRLRRDLHDGLGPTLASLNLNLEAAMNNITQNKNSDIAINILEKIQYQLQNALGDIRRLVYALRPPTLDEFGLLFTIHEQARQYQNHELSIEVDCPDEIPILPAAVEVAAYRIIQEALTNVVKHASATYCHVKLWMDQCLHVEVFDNGQGISIESRKGIGLISMKERAEELGGNFTVVTGSQNGTRVYVRIPLPEDDFK